MHFTLIPLKPSFFQLKCDLILPIHLIMLLLLLLLLFNQCAITPSNHSKQMLLNSNVYLRSQYTQLKLSTIQMRFFSTNMCHSTLKPLQTSFLHSNVPLQTQYTQIKPSNPQICLWPFQYTHIGIFSTLIPSNVYSCTQTTSNRVSLLSNDLNTLKCA